MCDALSMAIDSLKRVRVMNIKIGDLKNNQLRKIEGDELKAFLTSLSL
jgi:16S rRNA U516 pseudouridylate synthase RsuA-like enzyme